MFQSTEPSPPRDLSKDKLAVWDGWCAKGDREVAREAATKGVHIDLVKVFLAKRRKISANDASVWLNDEVEKHDFHGSLSEISFFRCLFGWTSY